MPHIKTDSRAVLSAMMEYSPIGMALVSTDGRCLKVNRAICDMLGYSREELLGRSFRTVSYPDDIAVTAEIYAALASQRISHHYAEKRYRHRNGTVVWAYVGWSVICDIAGKPEYIVAQITDITGRKQHEAEREDLTQILQLAVKASNIGIWSFDFDTGVTTLDARVSELWGRTESSPPITAETWLQRIHPDDRARIADAFRSVFSGTGNFDTTYRIALPDGRIRHIKVQSVLQRHEDGRMHRIVGTNWDLTSQIESAEALRRARDEAESANQAKNRFLANMSHELRTPLNAIIGFSEAMKSGVVNIANSELVQSYSADIHTSGQHLLNIINDLLDFSRIEAGRFSVDWVDLDLCDVINDVATMMRGQAEAANLAIAYDLDNAAPVVRADERAMRQILLNLMSNAIKFTPAGGKITCGLRDDGEHGVRCWVADTGIGIAAQDIPRLMRPFVQVDNVYSRQHQGVGLGLAIVRALVAMQGGEIVLTSEPAPGPR